MSVELPQIIELLIAILIGVMGFLFRRVLNNNSEMSKNLASMKTHIDKGIEEDIKENKEDIKTLAERTHELSMALSRLKGVMSNQQSK